MDQLGDEEGNWSYLPFVTVPTALDIVWCRFPELGLNPGPKCRPALVRSVALTEGHKHAFVEVCYGTSKLKSDLHPDDLIIQNAAQLNLLGLPQATRFELSKTIWLPWASEFFEARKGCKTPIIGHLTNREIGQLEGVMRRRKSGSKPRRFR